MTNRLEFPSKMIYNVYHRGGDIMNAMLSKWGNSLGIRVPAVIADTLGLQAGDQVRFELKDNGMFIKKEQTTSQLFEQFYGKPFEEITQADIGPAEEMDWGKDVGGEIF